MTATYSPSLETSIDQARFLFKDYNGFVDNGTAPFVVLKPLVFNEEYAGAIRVWGEDEGLAKVAENLASNFAQKIKKYANTRGGTSVEWPDRPDFYLQLAMSIRTNGFGTLTIMAGGIPHPSFVPTLAPDGTVQPVDWRLEYL